MSTADWYLAKRIFVPTVATLSVTAMLIMLEKGLHLIELVTAYGRIDLLGPMLGDLAPEFFSMGIPFSLLLGVLLAFRKLALRSELEILKGAGMSDWRLLRVPFAYAVVLMAINGVIIWHLQPLGRHAYEKTRYDLLRGNFGHLLNVGEFNSITRGLTLRIEASEQQGQVLRGIFLQHKSADGIIDTFAAAQGTLSVAEDRRTLVLRLYKGSALHRPGAEGSPGVFQFDSYEIPLETPLAEALPGASGTAELTLTQLRNELARTELTRGNRLALEAQLHYRAVRSAVMLLLPFLAVALAAAPKGKTSNLGIIAGVIVLVTYFKAAQHAERLAIQERADVLIALWLPFLCFAILTLLLHRTATSRPGGLPIAGLETALQNAVRRLGAGIGLRAPILSGAHPVTRPSTSPAMVSE